MLLRPPVVDTIDRRVHGPNGGVIPVLLHGGSDYSAWTMITIKATIDACARILGPIPTVRVSDGLIAVTVLLGDEPVITISPVGGQVVIGTRAWLRARPKQSVTLLHNASKKDEDWQLCTTASMRDLCYVLNLAVPGLEHRAMLPQRIAAKLGGDPLRRLHETDPRYWVELARWVDGSGLLTRNDAKFARIYARKLRKGEEISEAFRGWAMRTSAAAIEAGYPATEPVEIERQTPEDQTESQDSPDSDLAAPGGNGVDLTPQEVLPLVEHIRVMDVQQIGAMALAAPADEGRATRIRAAVIRAGSRDQQRLAKAAAAQAMRELRERIGVCRGMERLEALAADTAAALVVRHDLDPAIAAAAVEQWELATGLRLDGPAE
jgi:hypothetical protein